MTNHVSAAARGRWQSKVATVIALGWGNLWGGTARFEPSVNMIVCEGMRGGFARGGTTVGGVFLTSRAPAPALLRHESVHADQWAKYGLSFAVRYLVEEARHRGSDNRYEIEAGLEDGGYSRRKGK